MEARKSAAVPDAGTPISTPTSTPSTPALLPAPAPRDHLRIDLMDLPMDLDDEEEDGDRRVSFFRRRQSGNTWVVTLFIVVHLVAFAATMLVNDCPGNAGGGGGGQCLFLPLGRFSFQPLYENPLLGPSSSTLSKVGAIRRTGMAQQSKFWQLVTSEWLHAGLIHLVVNISSVLLVGLYLEQDYGPLRVGMIYVFSALMGSVTSAIFVQHIPAVGASGGLFGLLGATFAALVQNWRIYDAKLQALTMVGLVTITNFCIGFLPHVDNFSNIGGFFSGLLLGVALLYNPQLSIDRKKGIFDYDLTSSVKLKQKLDKPIRRMIAVLFFSMMLGGGLFAVSREINPNKHFLWLQRINCLPTKIWSCNENASACEAMVSDGRLTLTCLAGDKFRTFPFAEVSRERMDDLCSLICS